MRDSTDQIYAVADEIRMRCFGRLESLLSSKDRVWSSESADELLTHFVDTPDLGSGEFLGKLAGQLRDVSPEAVELMAHLVMCAALFRIEASTPHPRPLRRTQPRDTDARV